MSLAFFFDVTGVDLLDLRRVQVLDLLVDLLQVDLLVDRLLLLDQLLLLLQLHIVNWLAAFEEIAVL